MTPLALALDPVLLAALAGFGALLAAGVASDVAARRQARFAARLALACPRVQPEAAAGAGPAGLIDRAARVLEPLLAAVSRALFARPRDREEIRRLLTAAGHPAEKALAVFAGIKLVAAVAGGVGGWLAAGALLAPNSGALRVALIAGGAVGGSILPEMVLRGRRDARRRRMREALPDAIDLMVIAAYAGQSLDMAIDRVSQELRDLAPDLGAELAVTVAEMQTRPDRGEALRRFGERVDLREARALATTLVQTIRYGAPFTDSLRALGGDLRRARMIALEERGAKLPALLTLPLIVFILPAVFVVVVGPAVVAVTDMFGGP